MKHKFTASILKGLKYDGLPILKIKLLRDLSFNVLIDTSISYNLIDPDFIYFEVKDDYYTYFEDENYIGNAIPSTVNMYLFNDSFKKLGTHELTDKNGAKNTVDKINFNFEFKGEKYSELFSVVELFKNNNELYKIKNGYIDAVIGTDFLSKYNWIIDYKKKVIYSPLNP